MKTFLPLLALLLNSCAIADFTPYSGAQQNWPVSPGAFVERKYEVPVYRGNPDRPYKVLGYLSADTAPIRRRGVTAFMARRAKELGGDALILMSAESYSAGSMHTSSTTRIDTGITTSTLGYGATMPILRGKGDGIVIKFR